MVWYHLNMRGSHILVPRPKIRGIPEIMLCRILMFLGSSGDVSPSCRGLEDGLRSLTFSDRAV